MDRQIAASILMGLVVCSPVCVHADWMVGAFFGHAWTRPSTVAIRLPGQFTDIEIHSLEYRAESFRSPPYYGYRIGWIPDAHRWLSIEAEFIHAKVFAEPGSAARVRGTLRGAPVDALLPVLPIVERLAMSHGLNFILATTWAISSWGRRSGLSPDARSSPCRTRAAP